MSLALLNRQPVTWDSEAASYLTSVESADSQSLEPSVARAINTFVIDCKIRGIWGAIKSSCLLCGARTLSGALVPLKGTAPTNVNFLSSDYNRETGLRGDGSSKYLDSNRNTNQDDQNNQHLSTYLTSPATNTASYIGGGPSGTSSSAIGNFVGTGTVVRSRSDNLVVITDTNLIGFFGISRSLSSNFIARLSKTGDRIISSISLTPYNGNIHIFKPSGSNIYTNARISFYSIGESLDLRLLEQCVEKYMSIINILI